MVVVVLHALVGKHQSKCRSPLWSSPDQSVLISSPLEKTSRRAKTGDDLWNRPSGRNGAASAKTLCTVAFAGKELLFRRGRKVAENRVAMREAAESADNFAMVFRIPEIVVPVAVRISKRAKEANRFIVLFEGLGVH